MTAWRRIVLLLATLWAVPAYGHAALIGSTPADGAVLEEAPRRLLLVFDEAVSPAAMRLVVPGNRVVALDQVQQSDGTVAVALPDHLSPGGYALSWRVVSDDGHPVGGTLQFAVGSAAVAAAVATPGRPAAPLWLSLVAIYAAVALGLGAVAARVWLGLPKAGMAAPVAALLIIGSAAALASLGLQGVDVLGLPLAALGLAASWQAGLAGSYGVTALGVAAACALGLVAAPERRLLALAAPAGAVLALAWSGHGATRGHLGVVPAVAVLHLAAVVLWAGALLPLAGAAPAAVLARFSRVMPFAVALLLATGVALAAVQLDRIEALWTTDYGRLLLVKLALVAALLGLGGVNRWRLVPRLGEGGRRAWLRRSILAELALMLAIFGVVAAWRFTPPPRPAERAAVAVLRDDGGRAEITLNPARVGPMAAVLALAADSPADQVTLSFAWPDAGLEPIRRDAVRAGAGLWRVDGLVLPLAGEWTVSADLRSGPFTQRRLAGHVAIAP